jgi:hypothetical protein
VGEFAGWAAGDHESTRLRSVIGPPGCGKSTFLRQLLHALIDEPRCAVFPILITAHALPNYPETILQQLNDIRGAPIPVLLVDEWETTTLDERRRCEEHLLVPFLFSAGLNSRVVIARRDEHGLEEALLRWEEEVHELKGLDEPQPNGREEQVRRRLAAVAEVTPEEATTLLEWPDAPNAVVGYAINLDNEGRQALLNHLRETLTPNPYVNLTLLHHQLIHPATPLTVAAYEACLRAYVARAGLGPEYYDLLLQLSPHLGQDGTFTTQEYDARNQRAKELNTLQSAGVVARVSGTLRYRLEPAVVLLVRRLNP